MYCLFFILCNSHNHIIHTAYGQDSPQGKEGVKLNNFIKSFSQTSIEISTDKLNYVAGEHVKVSGTVINNNSSIPQKVSITVTYIGNSSTVPYVPPLFKPPFSSQLIYKASLYPVNNTFVLNLVNTATSGKYYVNASLDSTKESSFTTFNIVNPFTTPQAVLLYAVAAGFFIYIIILLRGAPEGVRAIQTLNFIFLTSIVGSSLTSIFVTDVELGPNSPIGIVFKLPSSDVDRVSAGTIDGQAEEGAWVINIGGIQQDNYSGGVQIPIYVVVLGLLGGYLRYLYETATTAREDIQNELTKIEKSISDNDKKKNERQRYFFFLSLKTVALLLLSPLLAMAVWLILVQAGFEGDSADRGHTGLFILAAVSFAIGLVTNEAVQMLINFVKDRFGKANNGISNKKVVSLKIDKLRNPIKHKEEQEVAVTVSHENNPIEEAIVKLIMKNEMGNEIHKYSGLTDDGGKFNHKWKIEEVPTGYYNLELEVKDDKYITASLTTSFEITEST